MLLGNMRRSNRGGNLLIIVGVVGLIVAVICRNPDMACTLRLIKRVTMSIIFMKLNMEEDPELPSMHSVALRTITGWTSQLPMDGKNCLT